MVHAENLIYRVSSVIGSEGTRSISGFSGVSSEKSSVKGSRSNRSEKSNKPNNKVLNTIKDGIMEIEDDDDQMSPNTYQLTSNLFEMLQKKVFKV